MIRLLMTLLLLIAALLAGLYLENKFAVFERFDLTSLSLNEPDHEMDQKVEMKTGEKKILYWVAPMDASFRRDKPGKSPMGMDLIPVYEEDAAAGTDSAVRISPEVINNIGVRTEAVQRGRFSRPIHTVAYVDYDETKISHIHIRVDGWIQKLVANAEGERVEQGQLLFTLYSPTLVNAQEEYLRVLTRGNQRLIQASREKLFALGLTQGQVNSLRDKGKAQQYLGVYAPQSGVITNLNVREGIFIKPENNIMSIASLDTVWMQVEVFEKQANWVREKQTVEATLPSFPGKKWLGEVDYVYPELDAITRTLRVRLKFANADENIKPNMYAYVSIITEHTEPVLHVNRQALILDSHYPRVIVALGEGRFEPRQVKVGMVNDERAEIIEGLKGDEQVVVSAQFLIDSEASLQGSFQRMTPVKNDEQGMQKGSMDIVQGRGLINTIDKEKRTINLSHEPIKQLDWPAMTMDIAVDQEINLDTIANWRQVRFYMVKDESGSYFIRRIDHLDAEGGE